MRPDSALITLSAILRIEKRPTGMLLHTAEAVVQLTVFSEAVIEVKAVRQGFDFENFSYAVIASPQTVGFDWSEDTLAYHLKTTQIHLKITKNSCRLSFYDTAGELLNEDEASLGIAWQGTEVSNYKKLQENERFIGSGQKSGNLDRWGSSYTNWNVDAFGYGTEADPLYGTYPFYMGLWERRIYGIFLDNTYQTRFNFGASTDRFSYFQAQDGELRYYFIHDDSVGNIIKHYTWLTGRIQLPPLWSLGFQQCRYSYYPDTEVLNIARTFREKDIPADVIYLDIHYMERYKVFTWDKERFAHPADLIARLKELGFHVVLILDPGVKVEEGYPAYEEGLKAGMFVQYPDGEPYSGQVWPGWCHFPDFTKPEVREWWGQQYKDLVEIGVEGFWNDMNEPAVWGKHFPDVVEFDYDGQRVSHKKAHNVYGQQMIRATYEGVRKLMGNTRPFTLTRAGYAGVQRYTAVWSGDNSSWDSGMIADCKILNSMGLAGLSFVGYDVGGFVGEAGIPLFRRWIALGAFAPFYRCHTMINSKDAEPWAFGEEAEEIARNYIKLRYRLLPYIYSLFYEATQTGMPVQRSLALYYPFDERIYQPDYAAEYLFGNALLVCPVTSEHPYNKVYHPDEIWYDLINDTLLEDSGEVVIETPKDKIPVFVRGGQLLLLQSDISTTDARTDGILEIHLYDGLQDSDFTYYEDDGTTYDFEQGNYYKRTLYFEAFNRELVLGKVEGSYPSKFKRAKVFFHGFRLPVLKPQLDAVDYPLSKMNYQFIKPISNFDPWETAEDKSKTIFDLPYIEIAWDNAEAKLKF
jgi:alpha-glucosidase